MSDISRESFDPKKHYIGVMMQQGRVQLDADWNEQQAIYQHRIETEARDFIGQSGVPQSGGGFRIDFTPDYSDLTISPGRIYVDGMLCELEHATAVKTSFLDGNRVEVENWLVDGQEFEKGQWVEFLDEWMQPRKLLRILDVDPDHHVLRLRTDEQHYSTVEIRQMSNLRLRRVTTYTTQPYYPTTVQAYPQPTFAGTDDAGLPMLGLHENRFLLLIYLDVWKRDVTWLDDPCIREVALGGPDTTTRLQTVWQVKILPIELQEEFLRTLAQHKELEQQLIAIEEKEKRERKSKVQELKDNQARLEQEIVTFASTLTGNSAFREWDELTAINRGTLNARTRPPDTPGNPRYQRLENQLYRVEIHGERDARGNQMYKWARDNASVVTRVESVSDGKVIVQGVGLDDNQGFARGQWVELINTERELNGLPGHFVQIKDVDPITGALTLTEPLPKTENIQHMKIRRWDGKGEIASTGDWLDLEAGVQVQFSRDIYRSGDYWLIPARTGISDIEWPPYQVPNLNPIPQKRAGSHHHYARLARVLLFKTVSVQDCRRRFLPLAPQAIHILGINWANDGDYSREILKDGLHITLDAAPDPLSISPATMIVTVEPALPGHGGAAFVMNGHIEVEANNIYWRWGSDEEGGIAEFFDKLDIFVRGPKHAPRVRVVLKGNFIWSIQGNQMFYLDGQAFGVPGKKSDGKTPSLTLAFPSGKGAQASDFESWFYLTEL